MKSNLQNISDDSLTKISFLAFEQSYNSVVVTTADIDNPLFVYVNPAFTKQTGYSISEVFGKNPKILQGEKTDRIVIDRLKKSLKERSFFQGQTINYRKDGSEYFLEWNISPIFNNDGVLKYFVSFQIDRTSKIKLQETTQELLIQQSKLAVVGELMNTMAHQWKQPLGVISVLAQRLLRKINKEFNKEDLNTSLEKIVEQTNFMTETMVSFQNFLRPVDLYKSFNVKKSIQETLALMETALIESHISVEFSCLQEDIEIFGSGNEFKQGILNIISNARDAFVMQNIASMRKIVIAVNIDNSFVSIEILDNAGGIKMSPIEKVFENNVSTKGANGTGLGLYIVKQIIERLKGEISVSVVEEKSTKFSIILPLK